MAPATRCWHRPADAARAAEQILEVLRQPFTVEGHEVFISASIGIALSHGRQTRPEELLREADVALYRAKAAGKAGFVVFDSTMNARALERLDLESALRRALDRGELRVYYQPKVDLVSLKIIGMEALARWEHPHLGLVNPSEFIPIAEETGLILPIGQWVLEEACRQASRWQTARPAGAPLVISVNLSARQLQHAGLAAQVAGALQQSGLAPGSLELELTESALMDDVPATENCLQSLRELGVQLGIDDFGTGYSSFSYLQRFSVNTLKVDRSFIKALEHGNGSAAILHGIASLGHALGLDVTAEGIETREQLAQTRAAGCDHGQGYYFARPVPAQAMGDLLNSGLPCPVLGDPSASG